MQLLKQLFTNKPTQDNAAPKPATSMVMDGLSNVLTGMGSLLDASRYHRYHAGRRVHHKELSDLYGFSGVARNLVEAPANEAFKFGLDVDAETQAELSRLDAVQKVIELSAMSRLFGGAVMVILAEDGTLDPAEPLNLERIKTIAGLEVYDAQDVQIDTTTGFKSYEHPELYIIHNGVNQVKVHHSRVIRMDGLYLPRRERLEHLGWGGSVLQPVTDSLYRFMASIQKIDKLAQDFGVTNARIKGLYETLLSGNSDLIAKRLNEVANAKSAYNVVMMDAEDESMTIESPKVQHYRELVITQMEALSADAKMPMSILFGRPPEGMNSTGDKDIQMWHASVQQYMGHRLKPVLDKLMVLLEAQQAWSDKPELIQWSFKPLSIPTAKEMAETRKINAEADKVYIDTGGINPAFVFHQRHNGGYQGQLEYNIEELEEFEAQQDDVELPADED